jgi:hypothetical protein
MEKSLELLEKLKSYAQRENRATELIANFSEGYAKDWDGQAWYFCVPKFFYEALDIKFTPRKINNVEVKMWTQGSWFNFSEGDKLYNHAYAYCDNFVGESSSIHPKICLSIESAINSIPRIKKYKLVKKRNLRRRFFAPPFLKRNVISDGRKDRYPGQVNFKIMVKNSTTGYWETKGNKDYSQDEFIELLIKGPPEEWDIF